MCVPIFVLITCNGIQHVKSDGLGIRRNSVAHSMIVMRVWVDERADPVDGCRQVHDWYSLAYLCSLLLNIKAFDQTYLTIIIRNKCICATCTYLISVLRTNEHDIFLYIAQENQVILSVEIRHWPLVAIYSDSIWKESLMTHDSSSFIISITSRSWIMSGCAFTFWNVPERSDIRHQWGVMRLTGLTMMTSMTLRVIS